MISGNARQGVDETVPQGFSDAVARRAGERADEGADDDGHADAQNRQEYVQPRSCEDAHQQVAAQMIGAEQIGRAGGLQGQVDKLVGIAGAQQGHENAEQEDQRQDDDAPAGLSVELLPDAAQPKQAQAAGGGYKGVAQSP